MSRFPVCRVLAVAALALPVLAAPPASSLAAAPARASAPAASNAGVALELTAVSPAVVTPGKQLVVSGVVRNDTTAPVARPLVRVVIGDTQRGREGVRAWAAATGPAQGVE